MNIDLLAIAAWITKFLSGTHAGPATLGIVLGVLLAETLAHALPPAMDSYVADRLTRLVCFGVSMCATFALDASEVGFFLAALAGLAGPTVHGMMIRYVAARWPNLTAKALIPGPVDTIAPRPIVPAEVVGEKLNERVQP